MNHKFTILLCLGFFFEGQAQNLLSNATFDTNITSRDNEFVNSSWVSDDGGPFSGNGSLQFGASFNNNAAFFMLQDQIAVQANNLYMFSGLYKIPGDSPAAFARIEVHWLRENSTEISVDDIWSFFLPTQDVWTDLSNSAVAPAEAVSVVFSLWFQSGDIGETDDPYGLWDDLLFVSDTIFISGFE